MQQIRDYFLTNARRVDSEITPKDKPLDDAEISQIDVDCAYHLYIGTSTTTEQYNGGLKDVYRCKMSLYVGAYNCDNENYDKGYEKAKCIRNELVNIINISENEYIMEAEPVTIVPKPAKDNEKVFVFEININISLVTCL